MNTPRSVSSWRKVWLCVSASVLALGIALVGQFVLETIRSDQPWVLLYAALPLGLVVWGVGRAWRWQRQGTQLDELAAKSAKLFWYLGLVVLAMGIVLAGSSVP